MDLSEPWADYKNQLFTNSKIKQTTIRCNTKKLKGINPMLLVASLVNTYLQNCKPEEIEKLAWRKSMYLWRQMKPQNWNPRHNCPQTCRGSKSICPVLIRPTDILLSQPGKSLRIIERRLNKYDTQKSKINRRRLERRILMMF